MWLSYNGKFLNPPPPSETKKKTDEEKKEEEEESEIDLGGKYNTI